MKNLKQRTIFIITLFFVLVTLNLNFAEDIKTNQGDEVEKSNIEERNIEANNVKKNNSEKTKKEESLQPENDGEEQIQAEERPQLNAIIHSLHTGISYGQNKEIATLAKKAFQKKEKDKIRSTNVIHKFADGVTAIVDAGSKPFFFVAGNDGFISKYSYPDLKADSWQFSSIPIKKVAVHPEGNLVAIYESDGFSVHQVSLWNWNLKKNIFSKRLSDSVVSLSWSARGSYLFIGNRSTEGIIVLDKNGKIQKIYKGAPGIVFLAATANSEKNIVTYGESGRLIYTSIKNKKKVKEFETESFLQKPTVIDNFKRLIGFKTNKVFVINGITGETVEKYDANTAIFATKLQDKKPIWIEKTNRKYQWCIRQGSTSSGGFYVPKNSKITAARHIKNHMVIGTEDGSIYKLSLNEDSTVKLENTLKYSFANIDDITTNGERVYSLQNGSIYRSDIKSNKFEMIKTSLQANRLLFYKDGLLLWSNEKQWEPIYHYSLKTNTMIKIATPKESVISLSAYDDSILYVEAFRGAYGVSFKSKQRTFTYNAPGIQNAVQIDKNHILIAKSSIDKTQSPVFIINTSTKETIPMSIAGNLVFSLTKNGSLNDRLNCFLVSSDPIAKTELLKIKLDTDNLVNSKFKPALSYDDEDINAFLATDQYDLLTNLGQASLIHYNALSGQAIRLKRSYSLPKKAVILKDYFVSLNYGGTISWYDRKNRSLIKTVGIKENE